MFKRGSTYSRKEIGDIYFPEVGRPKGGMWDTGYVNPKDTHDLVIFMNIGIAGRTGHDFENFFDEKNDTVVWFGKPGANSNQPQMARVIAGDLKPLFFARWQTSDSFTFLGEGKLITFKDSSPCFDGEGKPSKTIKLVFNVSEISQMIPSHLNQPLSNSSFALEKHLEDFIIQNWTNTRFGFDHDIYQYNSRSGQQYRTKYGPCDILAQKKDKSEFLIVELKKGRGTHHVVGQLAKYMGAIKEELAINGEKVNGCVVASEKDEGLKSALSVIPNTYFYKFEINFHLTPG